MPKQDRSVSFPLRLSHEVDRLFDELIHRPWGIGRELQGWNPSIDLYETSEAFILEADLPGVKGEDVKVEVKGRELILQGRRSMEQSYSDETFHYQERCMGDFVRRLVLPETVDRDKIKAEFRDGVLHVVLPKMKQESKDKGSEE